VAPVSLFEALQDFLKLTTSAFFDTIKLVKLAHPIKLNPSWEEGGKRRVFR